jgi:hypothetical protein
MAEVVAGIAMSHAPFLARHSRLELAEEEQHSLP